MKKLLSILLPFLLFFCFSRIANGQGSPEIFKYQGIARNSVGIAIVSQNISVKTGIYSGSPTGVLVWEETQSLTTDAYGQYIYLIGTGTSTGMGTLSSFSLIAWQSSSYYLAVSVDFGSGYQLMGNAQLMSAPYSFYSKTANSADGISLNDLTDADTTGIDIGKTLKWNGVNWVPSIDNHHDTVVFSYQAGNSINVDTANYANSFLHKADTVQYAFHSGSSNVSNTSGYSTNSGNSIYSDTTSHAINFISNNNNWHLTGNNDTLGNYFFGTIDSANLVFKTSASERMRLTASGQWAIGTTTPISNTQFNGNDGIQAWGTDSLGSLCDSSINTRLMWYPRKSALLIGQVVSNNWGDSKIGYYSFSEGYNNMVSGTYSAAFGYNNVVKSINSVCIGRNNYASIDSGVIDNGGLIAIGDSNYISQTRAIAIGYHNRAESGIAIGYHNRTATGPHATTFGKDNTADGFISIALGTNASTAAHKGCFVFADASGTFLRNTAINQFMVRASGGVIYYTDDSLINGVQLFAGGGSWASVSDRNKKTNFIEVNTQDILEKILELKITKWNYKSQDKHIYHIGPMAQDFYSAFNIGENNYSISTVDIDGVTFAGIKGLEETTRELSEKIKQTGTIKSELKMDLDFNSLENRLNRIEQTLNQK